MVMANTGKVDTMTTLSRQILAIGESSTYLETDHVFNGLVFDGGEFVNVYDFVWEAAFGQVGPGPFTFLASVRFRQINAYN